MDKWLGYALVERLTANLNEANFAFFVDELKEIVGIRDMDQPIEKLHWRGATGPGQQFFILEEQLVDEGLQEVEVWYSNKYFFVANFPESAISFAKISTRLEGMFGADPGSVSHTTVTNTLLHRPSVTAFFKYGANNRIRITFFGCVSDNDLCTREESRLEAIQYVKENKVIWGEDDS